MRHDQLERMRCSTAAAHWCFQMLDPLRVDIVRVLFRLQHGREGGEGALREEGELPS